MLALTQSLGQEVLDSHGARVGRLADLAARADAAYPFVTALQVKRGRRDLLLVPWAAVRSFEETAVELSILAAELGDRALEHHELLLARDVLDTQIVDIAGKRLVRVADVELVRDAGGLRVVAVDVGMSSLVRRLGLRRLARRARREAVAWEDLHMTSARGHALECSTAGDRLRRLGPAELAQLVARLPLARGVDVLSTIEPDRAADALGAARPGLGARVLRELSPGAATPILEEMPADDAAAALRHLEQDDLERLLSGVQSARAAELRRLLEHRSGTAGGLMTLDYRTAGPGESTEQIRARLASDPPPLEGLATVFVIDDEGRPIGALHPTALLGESAQPVPVPTLSQDATVDQVIDTFAVNDVLALPVVDADGRLVGAIAVDDVLEELLAERLPGRRRYDVLSVRQRAPS